MSIKVLLVDDHELLRSTLHAFLAARAEVEVVEAEDGPTAVRLASEVSPDVTVMDLAMPGLSGIEAMRQILSSNPGAKVVMLSGYCDQKTVDEAMAAGALGYVLKYSAPTELADAVQAVAAGRRYLSSKIDGEASYGF